MSETLFTDVVVNWVGGLGVLTYLHYIRKSRPPSFLERQVRFLLWCLALLFFVRGFFWIHPSQLLSTLTFVPATLLPLVSLLFVEALLRRHLPFLMKAFVAGGTVAFSVANLAELRYASRGWNVALLGFIGLTFLNPSSGIVSRSFTVSGWSGAGSDMHSFVRWLPRPGNQARCEVATTARRWRAAAAARWR